MSGIGAMCVGGPLAGKQKHVLYGKSFMVEELKPLLHRGFPVTREPISITTKYVLQAFNTRQGDCWEFWVPEGQTERQTLEILLTTYRDARRPNAEQ